MPDVARADHGGRSETTRRRTGFEGRRKALPADARRQNRSLLLRALFHAGPMSRADLARASGLTPTTVSNVIGELVAEGMIEEAGRTLSGSVGKPATLVSVVADARHVVCLDLSCAGEIRGAVVNLARKVVARRSLRRREASGAALIGQRVATTAIEIAGELASQTDRPLLGIGVATPGVVDTDGVVVQPPTWASIMSPSAPSSPSPSACRYASPTTPMPPPSASLPSSRATTETSCSFASPRASGPGS